MYCKAMRCAIYARVSTADQNCEIQLQELRAEVERRRWEVAGEYVDWGVSGAKASRPELDRLMTDARRGRLDCVAVWKLDRFGRSVLNLTQHVAELTALGVRFLATSQGIDTDQSNPTARLQLNILASVAEFERELIRERTRAGVKAAIARGAAVGRPKRIFNRQEVVRLRDEGLSWRDISRRLGVPTMTAVAAYNELQACTEKVPQKTARG